MGGGKTYTAGVSSQTYAYQDGVDSSMSKSKNPLKMTKSLKLSRIGHAQEPPKKKKKDSGCC